MPEPVVLGAVLYDPKVATIWDIIGEYFEERGCPIDVVFYADYQLQVNALLEGDIQIAWNSPLAWLEAQSRSGGHCRAIAMRDTDRDRVSHFVVKTDSGIEAIEDVRGKALAVGAEDSPQATLIPLSFLERRGLETSRDFRLKRFDVLVGKHGDHVGGELEAFQSLERGENDVCTMLDLNWETWTGDGTIDPTRFRILATTDKFDHCVFSVREDFDPPVEKRWLDALFSMSYANPKHREMMDMEGLKEWLPARTTGFGPLADALDGLGLLKEGKM